MVQMKQAVNFVLCWQKSLFFVGKAFKLPYVHCVFLIFVGIKHVFYVSKTINTCFVKFWIQCVVTKSKYILTLTSHITHTHRSLNNLLYPGTLVLLNNSYLRFGCGSIGCVNPWNLFYTRSSQSLLFVCSYLNTVHLICVIYVLVVSLS